MKQNAEIFRPVFTNIGTFTLHYDTFVRLLKPKLSEEGGEDIRINLQSIAGCYRVLF